MAQGYVIPHAIFDETSVDVASEPFYISPGWMVELLAFNFANSPVQPDPLKPKLLQAACLRRIMYKAFEPPEVDVQPCGVLPDITKYQAEILAENWVMTDGCEWSLTACDNYRLLDIPGAYRFILNDAGAVGTVLIYMMAHPLSAWPSRPSRLYFGE
ncbi:MAG: hypothetical protein LBQ79_00455 [Deltaproteobacteria bacterium]|jgi:hypothetical protein|nr:hypothetical protein [Deltaproteobacteria bacterium]